MVKLLKLATRVAGLSLCLAGCASQTPYQPMNQPGSAGYSDAQLDEAHYRVQFNGDEQTPADITRSYALLRAGELTTARNADWFQVVSRHTDRTVARAAMNAGHYGTELTIVVGTNPMPLGADVYDARQLISTLRPAV